MTPDPTARTGSEHCRFIRPSEADPVSNSPQSFYRSRFRRWVIASVMLIGALVRLSVVSGWARDYGSGLVYFALIVYLALALRMLWWGVTLWVLAWSTSEMACHEQGTCRPQVSARRSEHRPVAHQVLDLGSRGGRDRACDAR